MIYVYPISFNFWAGPPYMMESALLAVPSEPERGGLLDIRDQSRWDHITFKKNLVIGFNYRGINVRSRNTACHVVPFLSINFHI